MTLFNTFFIVAWIILPATLAYIAPFGVVQVRLQRLRDVDQGDLYVGVFEQSTSAPKGRFSFSNIQEAKYMQRIEAVSPDTTVTLKDIPFGDYVVCAYHDRNGNGKLDVNFLGIPREDMGISNNAKGGPMGGPKWETCRIIHNNDFTEVEPIEMIHLYPSSEKHRTQQ